MKIINLFLLLACPWLCISAQTPKLTVVETGIQSSFRGLCAVSEKVYWVSGSKGQIGRSTNGGKTWNFFTPQGFERSDFRDIEAWSENEAVVMASGTPAVVLRTTDAGAHWDTCMFSSDTAIFLDAFDFSGNKGIMLADAVNGRHMLYKTLDKGKTWRLLPEKERPEALKGEAAFAASGTCLRMNDAYIAFGTNYNAYVLKYNDTLGVTAREKALYTFRMNMQPWNNTVDTLDYPLTYGLYSIVLQGSKVLGVPSDYLKTADSSFLWFNTFFDMSCARVVTIGRKYTLKGYKSCIQEWGRGMFVTCGTTGVSYGKPDKMKQLSDKSFNVIQLPGKGSTLILAGDRGRIGILKKN